MATEMPAFSVHAVVNGPQCDLVLTGDVDLEFADALVEVALSRMADSGVQRLFLDFGAVTFLDSTGLGALVTIRNALRESGQHMVLVNVPERVRQILAITGLDAVFAIRCNGAPPTAMDVTRDATRSSG
jgi:anti-sigma B factor antagonist